MVLRLGLEKGGVAELGGMRESEGLYFVPYPLRGGWELIIIASEFISRLR